MPRSERSAKIKQLPSATQGVGAKSISDLSPRGQRATATAQLVRSGPRMTAQRQHLQSVFAGARPIAQLAYAKISSVYKDIWHPQANQLFDAATLNAAQHDQTQQDTHDRIKALGEGKRVNYLVVGDRQVLSTRDQLIGLQNKSEIMYVAHGGNVYVTGRDNEKKPHPTLAGGDPNVTDAGTITRRDTSKAWSGNNIQVTNDSGHFRLGDVSKPTLKTIQSAAATTTQDLTTGSGWQVVGEKGVKKLN